MTVLVQLGLWLLRKLGVALAIAGVILLVGGVFLYLNENIRSDARRREVVAQLQLEAARLRETAGHLQEKIDRLREDLEAQRRRAEIAKRLFESYQKMNSFWDWLFGTSIDPEELEKKKNSARSFRDEALASAESIVEQTASLTAEHAEVARRLAEVERRVVDLEKARSPIVEYGWKAWSTYRWVLAGALAAFFFGPTLMKVVSYYVLAPLIGRARSVRFEAGPLPPVRVERGGVSSSIALNPGEAIFVRERFLQASDEALRRRTRFVLDWHIPLTCAACGLIELVELRNDARAPAQVTVSTQDDTAIELSVVDVPEGGGLVLRPSFLAGVVLVDGRRLEIRRHWRLFHLHSWLTLQFRFFQFRGPCRLVVAGSRGVRAEVLTDDIVVGPHGRRTNQDSTIGFTPDLAYRSVRAETFWAYYRDRNPLFDDLFQGTGTFLCQEVSSEGAAARARRFWSRLWDAVLKVFGV